MSGSVWELMIFKDTQGSGESERKGQVNLDTTSHYVWDALADAGAMVSPDYSDRRAHAVRTDGSSG